MGSGRQKGWKLGTCVIILPVVGHIILRSAHTSRIWKIGKSGDEPATSIARGDETVTGKEKVLALIRQLDETVYKLQEIKAGVFALGDKAENLDTLGRAFDQLGKTIKSAG